MLVLKLRIVIIANQKTVEKKEMGAKQNLQEESLNRFFTG